MPSTSTRRHPHRAKMRRCIRGARRRPGIVDPAAVCARSVIHANPSEPKRGDWVIHQGATLIGVYGAREFPDEQGMRTIAQGFADNAGTQVVLGREGEEFIYGVFEPAGELPVVEHGADPARANPQYRYIAREQPDGRYAIIDTTTGEEQRHVKTRGAAVQVLASWNAKAKRRDDVETKFSYGAYGLRDYKNPGDENPAMGAVHGRGWIQETYESAGGESRQRAAALRKLGYDVTTAPLGYQVTPVGQVRTTLVNIRPGRSGDEHLERVPPAETIRWNPDSEEGAYEFGLREGTASGQRDVARKRFIHDAYRRWLGYAARASRPRLEAEWRRGYQDGAEQTRGNPAEDAEALSAAFHGRPASEETEYVETIREHEHLTELGDLVELEMVKPAGIVIEFTGTKLASNENGTQLFLVGGDQSVDLRLFKKVDRTKESINLGPVKTVVYHTAKFHLDAEDKKPGPYSHDFDRGAEPVLRYDARNRKLYLDSGRYSIRRDMGRHSAGIRG